MWSVRGVFKSLSRMFSVRGVSGIRKIRLWDRLPPPSPYYLYHGKFCALSNPPRLKINEKFPPYRRLPSVWLINEASGWRVPAAEDSLCHNLLSLFDLFERRNIFHSLEWLRSEAHSFPFPPLSTRKWTETDKIRPEENISISFP